MMWKLFAALMLIGVVTGRANVPYNQARLREAIERECEINGAKEHYGEVEVEMVTFVNCVFNLTDQEALKQLHYTKSEDVPEAILNFVKKTCKNRAEILQCFNKVVDVIAPCTDKKSQSKLEDSKLSMIQVADLFCKDDSKTFSGFIHDGALTCMENQIYPIVGCTAKIQTLENYKTITDAEACAKIDEISTCILDVLHTCPKPSAASFAETLFRTLRRSTTCASGEEENKVDVNIV